MTDETPGLGPDQPDQVRRTRAASVTLRDRAGADRDVSEPLDAANKSLMDALRFSYFLMGVAMAILAMLYVASGFQSIAESERGVRLSLGRVIDAGRKGMLVKTSIIRTGEAPVVVEWLVTDRPGRVVIADIVIEGVSMLVTEREEIGGMLEARGGNVEKLIADLATC